MMKQVVTNDGSPTFYNEEFGEHYHSISGAIEEAREKFVKPSKIVQKAQSGKVVVLDICFGLGYNTAVAIQDIKQKRPECELVVFGLEKDVQVFKTISQIQHVPLDIKAYGIVRELALEVVSSAYPQVSLHQYGDSFHLFVGDARATISLVPELVDAVFLDPFSPKVCPQLWEYDFLKSVVSKMKHGGILTTYSCARVVRDNLRRCGLIVMDGPSVGRRGPSTIAIKQ